MLGRTVLLGLALLCGGAIALAAEDCRHRFDRISLDDGLSNPNVHCVFQDPTGFIWVGTHDGLNRFEGREFKVYRPDGFSLQTGKKFVVQGIVQAEDGSFWLAGGLHGFFHFDPVAGKFIGAYSFEDGRENWLASSNIKCVEKAGAGKLWVGTDWGGLHRYDPESGEMEHFPLRAMSPGNTNQGIVLCVHSDPVDPELVLIGSHGMGLVRIDPVSGELHFFKDDPEGKHVVTPPQRVNSILKGSSGIYWVAASSGLYQFDPKSERFLAHHVLGAELDGVGKGVSSVAQDEDGHIWVSSHSQGVARFFPETGLFRCHRHDPADSRSLSHNEVSSLFRDRGGMIWAAMGETGLCVLDPNGDWIYEHQFYDDFSRPTDSVKLRAVLQDREQPNVVWMGTNEGLIHWDRETGERRKVARSPGSSGQDGVAYLAYRKQGGFWVGAGNRIDFYEPKSGGIIRFESKAGSSSELLNGRIHALHEDGKERLWVGKNRGVRRFDLQSGELVNMVHDPENVDSIGAGWVTKIHEDSSGNVWFGHHRNGISMVSNGGEGAFYRFESEPYKPGVYSGTAIHSIHEDTAKGVIWFGTNRGLFRISIESKELTWIDSFRSEVIAIEQEDSGAFWLRLRDHVVRVPDPYAENPEYLIATGAAGIERGSLGGVSSQLSDGAMLFQSTRGVLVLDPKKFRLIDPPEAKIIDFQLMGGEPHSLKDQMSAGKIVLSDTQNRVMRFKFAAFNYAAPKNNRFAYRLEGLEDGWRYLEGGELPVATYTTLDAGEYVFKVKAANSQGVWSEDEASISLTVLPPWWETWWARSIAVVGLTSLCGLFVNHRVRAAHKRADLLEAEAVKRELLNQKLRISEERFKSFITNSTEQVWCVEIDPAIPLDIPVRDQAGWFLEHAHFVEANEALAEAYSSTIEEVLTWKFEKVMPGSLPTTLPLLEDVARAGFQLKDFETDEVAKDGSARIMLNNLIGIIREGKVVRVWGTTRDVTEQRRAEEAIRGKNEELEVEIGKRRLAQDKLHQLTSRLINTQEHERRHVARELHDDLTQRLAAMAMDARIAERDVENSPEKARIELREIQEDLTEMATSTQELSRQLHPKILEELGLSRAVRAECRRFGKRFEISMGVETDNDIRHDFTQEESLCLYRILQEGLGNISKHAKASSVEVSLLERDEAVVLTVKDDGVGFDLEEKKQGGSLGVVSMCERARLCGASFELTSEPDQGTKITVVLPTRLTNAS